jgi:hypothetical protein
MSVIFGRQYGVKFKNILDQTTRYACYNLSFPEVTLNRIVQSLAVISFTFITSSFLEVQESFPPDEPESGAVVCEPTVYPGDQHDCLLLGPARFLTDLSIIGLTIPLGSCPSKPDPALATLPYYYFRVSDLKHLQRVPPKRFRRIRFPQGLFTLHTSMSIETAARITCSRRELDSGAGYRIGEISTFQGLEFQQHRATHSAGHSSKSRSNPHCYATGTTGQEISHFKSFNSIQLKMSITQIGT